MTVSIGATTLNGTAFFGVGLHGDFVTVDLEVSNIGGIFGYGEGEFGLVRISNHKVVVQHPVFKSIALVGRGSQSAALTVSEGAPPTNGTTIFRASLHSDFVAVDLEVGHIRGILRHSEAVDSIRGNYIFILCPVDEMIALVGHCN